MISYLDDAVMLVQQIRALEITALLCGGSEGLRSRIQGPFSFRFLKTGT